MSAYYRLTTSKAEQLIKTPGRYNWVFLIGRGKGVDSPETKEENHFANLQNTYPFRGEGEVPKKKIIIIGRQKAVGYTICETFQFLSGCCFCEDILNVSFNQTFLANALKLYSERTSVMKEENLL